MFLPSSLRKGVLAEINRRIDEAEKTFNMRLGVLKEEFKRKETNLLQESINEVVNGTQKGNN